MSKLGLHHGKIVRVMGQLNPLRPRNQILVVGAGLATGAPSGAYVGTTVHSLKQAGRVASTYRKTVGPMTRIASALSTVESARKIRRGGYKPAFDVNYVPMDPAFVPPAPHIGPIPIVVRRLELGAEKIQSRGGQHTISSRMARTKARKSMRGPSAQRSKKTPITRFRRDEERYRGRR